MGKVKALSMTECLQEIFNCYELELELVIVALKHRHGPYICQYMAPCFKTVKPCIAIEFVHGQCRGTCSHSQWLKVMCYQEVYSNMHTHVKIPGYICGVGNLQFICTSGQSLESPRYERHDSAIDATGTMGTGYWVRLFSLLSLDGHAHTWDCCQLSLTQRAKLAPEYDFLIPLIPN